ncbi:glyoxalase-like domain protein [filamentous cyanobacterium LEGE 11480]|uniref:Glyoxalase-like domain protein n=1 Tax=Romeriopsis navalis LEGE 11480 TaxID=2777977 RepID=A0A928VLL3_9CYAN|nr:glyoxalase-like domain protein [Romeriopsis navalis]MBE9028871.1 glyoxalase-like domain protein [Romeriopsis navalis LEGE 11480]
MLDALLPTLPLASLWSSLGDGLFSTQGIMVLLLAAYAGAMWTFLSSAPKVYTIMVSDLEVAKQFYEGMLNLAAADIPLHYYYNYDQSLGTGGMGMDPMLMPGSPSRIAPQTGADGLWYQLRKNAQLHIVTGANIGDRGRQRHISFDRDGLEQVLIRVQTRGLKYKIQQERPLDFLVKDYDGRTLELCEMRN